MMIRESNFLFNFSSFSFHPYQKISTTFIFHPFFIRRCDAAKRKELRTHFFQFSILLHVASRRQSSNRLDSIQFLSLCLRHRDGELLDPNFQDKKKTLIPSSVIYHWNCSILTSNSVKWSRRSGSIHHNKIEKEKNFHNNRKTIFPIH